MKRMTTFFILILCGIISLNAQDFTDAPVQPAATSGDAWEVGLHVGHAFAAGNIDFIPGYGGGLHFRKALDHVFSLRLDLMYAKPKGEDAGNVRSYEGTFMNGSIQAIANLNNLKWDLGERKTALYAFGGFGINSFESEVTENGEVKAKIESDVAAHADLGAGIAFRINSGINIGIEHKATLVFGDRADKLDGVETLASPDGRATFRDVFNYTNVRINFNLRGKNNNTEPLYWLNPLDAVLADVQKLKDTRVTLSDNDGDGVIDMLDEEENTPEGAIVNSKGLTVDSDGDGIPNHEDKEPYSLAGYEVNDEGVAQIPDIMVEVEALLDEKLKNFQPTAQPQVTPTTSSAAAWYLPAIYFGSNSSRITPSNVGVLADISAVINANPNLRFVVTGHTDQAGSEDYNNQLSYQRALNVVNNLTENHGVSRSQLILQWKGEVENLIKDQAHEVNRRVQIKVATNESEMAPPAGN